VNVVGIEANSCSTFDTPHLHKARKGGKYFASTKKTIATKVTMTMKQTTMMAKTP
jgi:hypothetical protein